MADTYTYTARNVENPELVMTFTLENNHLRLSMPDMLGMIGQVSGAEEKLNEAKEQLRTQARPGVVKAIESVSGPIHVNDVSVKFADERLSFSAWQRLANLRLAPYWLNLGQVDNAAAAEAFVTELKSRQARASYPGRFFGPLDYWLGWAALGFIIAILLRWPRKGRTDE